MTQNTADRLYLLLVDRLRVIGGTRHAAEDIAAEIDGLTAERDTLAGQLADVVFAAHMPIDYEYGLPSWINQYLYAGWIGAKISPHIMQMIEGGTLTFPDSPAEKALTAARAEVARLRPAAEAWETYEALTSDENEIDPGDVLWNAHWEAAARARAAKGTP